MHFGSTRTLTGGTGHNNAELNIYVYMEGVTFDPPTSIHWLIDCD